MTEPNGITGRGPVVERSEKAMTDEAVAFVALLHRRFAPAARDLS